MAGNSCMGNNSINRVTYNNSCSNTEYNWQVNKLSCFSLVSYKFNRLFLQPPKYTLLIFCVRCQPVPDTYHEAGFIYQQAGLKNKRLT